MARDLFEDSRFCLAQTKKNMALLNRYSEFCLRMCVQTKKMVLPARFQRATFRLGGGRSMQLSYGSMSVGEDRNRS
jgi:hypothetical protein